MPVESSRGRSRQCHNHCLFEHEWCKRRGHARRRFGGRCSGYRMHRQLACNSHRRSLRWPAFLAPFGYGIRTVRLPLLPIALLPQLFYATLSQSLVASLSHRSSRIVLETRAASGRCDAWQNKFVSTLLSKKKEAKKKSEYGRCAGTQLVHFPHFHRQTAYPTPTMSELQLKPYTTVDGLLLQLAQWCIDNNFYRKDLGLGQRCHPNPFRNFTHYETEHMNEASAQARSLRLEGGYVFLDEPNGTDGMIWLYLEPCGNPKWSFWMEDGLRVCCA